MKDSVIYNEKCHFFKKLLTICKNRYIIVENLIFELSEVNRRKAICLAEGVMLSGANSSDCSQIALRRSPIFKRNQKGAEGVKL